MTQFVLKKNKFNCFDEASPIIEKAIQLQSPTPILAPGSDCFRSLVTMSYQWDNRGYPFAARRTNNKLYVTTTVRQNGLHENYRIMERIIKFTGQKTTGKEWILRQENAREL